MSLGTPMFVDGEESRGGGRGALVPEQWAPIGRQDRISRLPDPIFEPLEKFFGHTFGGHFCHLNLGHDDMEPDASTSGGGGGEAGKKQGRRDTLVELQNRGGVATVAVPVAQRKPSYCAKREAAEYKSRTKPKKGPQIFAAVSVSTGCLSYGICMAYTSSAIPSMMDSALHLSDSQASWMSSLLALGAMFGSLSAVFLMDAVGRKASLLAFSVMSLFIGWTMMMAASQPWQLYVGRFLLGLGAGLEITISPVYIHETTMRDMRDICGSFPQVCL